jgi:peptide/nickel transport system substrate-binding protein
MPLGLLLIVAGIFAMPGVGCRRASTLKPLEESDATPAGEALPQRVAPPLPPLMPAPEQVPDPPSVSRGGAIHVHLDTEPSHLNPLADPDAAALQVVAGLVYEPLIDCPGAGGSGAFRPVLAESWQISADGLRISLRLRAGVKWHDGHGFGPLDAQATLETLLFGGGKTGTFLRSSLQDVVAVEIAVERIVRIVLKRPSDFALRALCDIPILPDHLMRGVGSDATALAKQPVGTGPFRFAGWDRGKRIKLARASAYWGRAPALDEITFDIDLDGARSLTRTRRGEIDVLPRVLRAHYPEQVDSVTLHGALSLWRLHPERWAYVAVNHRRPPLGDARFRRALSALWDREHFARDLHQGLAHPIGAPPFAELGPSAPGRDRAIAELEGAGYRDTDADGVRDVAGEPIRQSLLIASGGRTAVTEAHAFVFEARKTGLLLDLTAVDPAVLLARVKKADFDLALLLWEGRPDEDPGLMFGSGGPFNFAGYRSAEVDATLEALRLGVGPTQRQSLLAALGAQLAHDQPVLFLYQFDVPALVARRVHGLAAVGDRIDLRRAWVDR